MDDFNWLVATVGMVLALGITRLLANGVVLFRSRRRATLDWLPIVWSLCILYSMLEFSFVLHRMTGLVQVKTFAGCVVVFAFAVILFVAAALVLPTQELPEGGSLRGEFAEEGR